ncbi:MAG: LEA type 2 family protein [Burkholderiales bacterium]
MRTLARVLVALALALLAGCAGLVPGTPLEVNLVGLEPLPGQGMEGRFLARLRVQNPNDRPVDYDGVSIELDVRGSRLATGVSDATGSVPRFGEAVIEVPVSVPVTALVRQALGFATGDRTKVDYRLRGRLAGPGFGGARFDASGEFALPPGLAAPGPR